MLLLLLVVGLRDFASVAFAVAAVLVVVVARLETRTKMLNMCARALKKKNSWKRAAHPTVILTKV